MSFRNHLLVVGGTLAVSIVLGSIWLVLPCKEDFFIGLCGLAKAIGLLFLFFFFVIFIVISSALHAFLIRKKSLSRKGALALYLFSYVLAILFSPLVLTLPVQFQTSRNWSEAERISPQIIANYQIDNFSESPVVGSSGKYEGIQVTFNLQVKKSGTYSGSMKVLNPEEESTVCINCLFGNYHGPTLPITYLTENIPHKFSVILGPADELKMRKIDGPYAITIAIEPIGEDTKLWREDDGIVATGDADFIERRRKSRSRHGFTPVVFNGELHTRPYNYTDFVF